ncbi:Leucine efflux protein [Tritonibacter multivorans]|uniref:Leucine efflux protein n=2 Tax=Tritonibacter multivorans TaxID=928856 RepID=A0A0P1GVY3_9RHOB|nr:LysE family translocator [Tritonibacter multivorans]MDA7419845.1 LysE family translocator [Tritonibacter multivorans]CUH79206.1 Leucine efflux protein [Tritonibacter multivorans]SFC14940.1 Threonine/homoserine/homoserine lactone efflux protein [Tritonibacter multivorans]
MVALGVFCIGIGGEHHHARPGPANLNTLRRALQLGWVRVLPTIFGNALGLAVGGLACAFGAGALVLASDLAWALLQGLGVVYLLWLGGKLLITHETLLVDGANDPAAPRAAPLFREAFLLAVTNPKALLFYLALLPQSLDPTMGAGWGLALQAVTLVLTYCALSILSLSTYAALASALRNRVMTQARYTAFRRGSGIVILAFALKLLVG